MTRGASLALYGDRERWNGGGSEAPERGAIYITVTDSRWCTVRPLQHCREIIPLIIIIKDFWKKTLVLWLLKIWTEFHLLPWLTTWMSQASIGDSDPIWHSWMFWFCVYEFKYVHQNYINMEDFSTKRYILEWTWLWPLNFYINFL